MEHNVVGMFSKVKEIEGQEKAEKKKKERVSLQKETEKDIERLA